MIPGVKRFSLRESESGGTASLEGSAPGGSPKGILVDFLIRVSICLVFGHRMVAGTCADCRKEK